MIDFYQTSSPLLYSDFKCPQKCCKGNESRRFHGDSLGFAKTVLTKSEEQSYDPEKRLKWLSCGSQALRKINITESDCAAKPDCEIPERILKKKVPEENDYILINLIDQIRESSSNKKATEHCCDGEDSGKTSGNTSKETKDSSPSSVTSGEVPNTKGVSHIQRGNSSGGDDDDDDNEHHRRNGSDGRYESHTEDRDDNDGADDDDNGDGDGDDDNGDGDGESKVQTIENHDDSGLGDDNHKDDMSSSSSSSIIDFAGQDGMSTFAIPGLKDHVWYSRNEDLDKPKHTPPWPKKAGAKENEALELAFICNTEEYGSVERCSGRPCYNIHVHLKHSQECKYRVLGGCQECLVLAEIYINHVQQCKNAKCVIPRCSEIADHMKNDGVRIITDWGYRDDKIFFGESWGVDISKDLLYPQNENQAYAYDDLKSAEISSEEIEQVINQALEGNLSTGLSANRCVYPDQRSEVVPRGVQHHVQQRPIQLNESQHTATVLHPFDEDVLGVHDGQYVEGVQWVKVHRDRTLGRGSFGKVYLTQDIKTSKLFAVKMIPESKYNPNELGIWQKISGENIRVLSLYGAVKIKDTVTVFMEYMDGGSITQLIYSQPDGCLDDGTVRYILREFLEGLDFLHSRQIIHRDIKGDNILANSTLTLIKLGDYGTAVHIDSQEDKYTCGTVHFMSPEACQGVRISFSTDIWGAAISVIEMLTGKRPFSDFIHVCTVLYKIGSLKESPPIPEHLDSDTRKMLQDMLAIIPSERPSARELLGYPQLSEENCPPPLLVGSDEEGNYDDGNDYDDNDYDGNDYDGNDYDDSDDGDGDKGEAYLSNAIPLSAPYIDNLAAADKGCDQQLIEDDEDLQQLQEEMLCSLSLDGVNISDYLPKADLDLAGVPTMDHCDHVDEQNYDQLMYYDDEHIVGGSLQNPFSIKDLTKIELLNTSGSLLLTVREKPSRTFGQLLMKLHSQIKEKDGSLDCFAVQLSNNSTVDIDQSIGRTNLTIILCNASSQDWNTRWKWRITSLGFIQHTDHVQSIMDHVYG